MLAQITTKNVGISLCYPVYIHMCANGAPCILHASVAARVHVCFLAHPALFLVLLPYGEKDDTDTDGRHSTGDDRDWRTTFRHWYISTFTPCLPLGPGYPLFAFASPLSIHFLIFCSLLPFPFFLFSSTLLIFFYCPSDPFLPE